jgi:malate synthase
MTDVRFEAHELVPEVLTAEAVGLLTELHARFDARRRELLAARPARRASLGFLDDTREIRSDDGWRVSPPPPALQDRRVEITGPTDRKLVINALNSGARGFMADFEDANSPTWDNQLRGQVNLRDALRGEITYRDYRLDDEVATLLVRPRGWHLPERHVTIDDEPLSASLFDFGLMALHTRQPYWYLPKLESHLEARLWADVFTFLEEALGLERGHFRATVLIETVPAVFEMDEILYELRDHSAGLNAGRWDYLFSMIKCLREDSERVMPDRNSVGMTAPFMRAYTDLLVKTCHRRGAHAMGGMAAFIPSRHDAEVNERALAKVREDKAREAGDGFDGTWVAHPDLVPVATEEFDRVLGSRPNQVDRQRPEVDVTREQLLDVVRGDCTEEGLRNAVDVGFRYISFWLSGRGAAAIHNLMEDAATAEICRSQIWQWIRHGVFPRERVVEVLDEVTAAIRAEVGEETWQEGRPDETRTVFERVALSDDFPDFLTLEAYPLL